MKTKPFLVVAALACATSLFAAPPASKGKVDVVFDQPEKYTDVKDGYTGTDRGREGFLSEIKDYLTERAPRYLAEGQTLTLTFTDIDLAGDFEPWRGPQFSDIRVVKDIYPPRMHFSYKVTDATGAVVKEGQEKLIELGFQMTASPISAQDHLRYEKAMIDSWLHTTFQKQKK